MKRIYKKSMYKYLICVFIVCLLGIFITDPYIENYIEKSSIQKVTKEVVSGIFEGSSKNDKGEEIVIELELEKNIIKHIELIDFNDDIAFSKKSIILFDNIICKNSIENLNTDDSTEKLLADAIDSALKNAGITKESLAEISTTKRNQTQKEYECDLVIVGAGGAGLTAAIEAKTQGIENIIILEKMSFTGGNTRMSGGSYGAPCNWIQIDNGITGDSNTQYFNDIYNGGYRKGNPDLIHIVADNALDDAIWLRDFVGVKFKNEQTWYEGHTYKRTLCAEGDGSMLIDTLLSKAIDMGVIIHYTTKATHLIKNDSGAIIGVEGEQANNYVSYKAKYGVILATGGFGANSELISKYNPDFDNLKVDIPTTNSPAIVGDGILMAEEAGASLVNMDYIQLYPINNPATGNFYLLDFARLNDNAILVNKEGYRFVNELETRDVIAKATLKQTNARVYELIDNRTTQEMRLEEKYAEEIQKCIDQGVMIKGTLKECASFMGIPVSTLQYTINKYNNMVINGKDTEFDRKNIKYIDKGPYYMFSSIVSVHHTIGGVEIDTSARVIDKYGNAIPGLYAAGEVTGGIHGQNRLGSVALADSVVFGRIAAKTVASSIIENYE